ncbi:MAG: transposase [Cytophagales bacterium]
MEQKNRQLSLMDAVLSYSRRKKTSKAVATLSEIDKIVNWQALVGLLKELDKTQGGKGGRPPISFEIKLKMLFLQHTFNLSDEQLEDQLIDRLSFQQFVGLDYEEEIPDFTASNIRKRSLTKDGRPQGDSPRKENEMMTAEAVANHVYRA